MFPGMFQPRVVGVQRSRQLRVLSTAFCLSQAVFTGRLQVISRRRTLMSEMARISRLRYDLD